ncbi:ArgK/MeaB family GTPase [Tepidamorphus sp. 3E244]|uniref:ArgK/MeaB family GTPase n=1 Tax=Tepidamorphus sp. 3E244 TaxID=3385498 RepID=UPI0038FCF690
MSSGADHLAALRTGGKQAVARALTALERGLDPAGAPDAETADLLDAAIADPTGIVIGLTGPPGVGKSTLTGELLTSWRKAGLSVGVIAVDPSSQITGGALLGDRTRIRTAPDDDKAFVRSLAARDRLGGLSDHSVAAALLMRAVYDRVIVETVGIGQSEADIGLIADTLVLCVQPGSGDSLQFMKAGIMELPDVIAVTKSDMGAAARRARADVEGALGLVATGIADWKVPVVALSAASGEGIDDLLAAISSHRAWLDEDRHLAQRRQDQARAFMRDFVKSRHGRAGLNRVVTEIASADARKPFEALRRLVKFLDR